ncbi:hypothetical protein RFI_11935 [Reticulomyxa filosa]|uniref:Uncharacterized protein n=1 Tax=Reticulomyxa filosa TaxID=46433 RepID=X6NHH7_RETFI|nr:hypothetical protein RFI_11935 [Reticulomyxa filosa]|eukprot:ETO25204.1 hypothetical protein RFI_11935 [Reticulomyxa filosa]
MTLYFVDAYDKKFKVDQFSLGVYGVNKRLLKQKVLSDNESLQFLWICALVSTGPMLVIGWITDYVYIEFFSNSAWHFVCGPKDDTKSYFFLKKNKYNKNGGDKSKGYPSFLDLIVRVCTTFVISWGLVKFVAEWILTSEGKIANLQEKHLSVSVENLQLLNQLQEKENEKEKKQEPETTTTTTQPPPVQHINSQSSVGEKPMDKVIAANLELVVPSPSDENH